MIGSILLYYILPIKQIWNIIIYSHPKCRNSNKTYQINKKILFKIFIFKMFYFYLNIKQKQIQESI